MKDRSNQNSSARPEVTKDRIIRDLKEIGVKEGDHISVALSFKSIGYVKSGPEAFIDALLEAVGPNGTIMMNTHTKGYPLCRVASDYIFDYRSTPAVTGLVPNTFMKRRNSIRSRNPICSITAIGKLAKYLTKDHDENSNLYAPYSKLAKVNGKCLFIGLGNNLVAVRHEAQYLAGLFNIVKRFNGVKYIDDEEKEKVYIFHEPPCVKKFPEIVPTLRRIGITRIGRIGLAHSILAPARELIDVMVKMLKEKPTLALCDHIFCLDCRELERKMDLYNKIESPKYFQRIIPIRKIIASINKYRMNEYRYLSFQRKKKNEVKEIGRLRSIMNWCRAKFAGIFRIAYLVFIDLLHKSLR